MERQESVMKTFEQLSKEVKKLEANMHSYWNQWDKTELMDMQGISSSYRTNDEIDSDDLEDILHDGKDLDEVLDDMFEEFMNKEKL